MKYILKLSLTLFLITGLVAAALAGVNAVTKDRIAAVQTEKINKAITALFPESTHVRQLATTEYHDETGMVKAVYQANGGWAMEVRPSGFGGEITLMVGVGRTGSVTGVQVISHAETPGLGAVAADKTSAGEAFRNSFVGKSGTLSIGDIDAISSATITSQAIVDGVNAALNCGILQEQEAGQ